MAKPPEPSGVPLWVDGRGVSILMLEDDRVRPMRLLLIRPGDPDFVLNLTVEEAQDLSEYLLGASNAVIAAARRRAAAVDKAQNPAAAPRRAGSLLAVVVTAAICAAVYGVVYLAARLIS